MSVDEILAKRLVFLSGKGGVGKSVLAATLAWISARKGRRTLLVELDTIETIPKIFGRPDYTGKYQETELAPGLSSLHVDGKSGLEEYLQMVLKSRKFVQRVFRSPLYQYFINIAPGLKELMAVGKLWDLERKANPATREPLYDLLIVDTPATGHTVSYLQMPLTAAGTVKRGLVRKEAQKVVDLLQDPAKTSFHIVTTLAEMPVNEAIELHETVSTRLGMPVGCLFVNQVYPPFLEGSDLESFRAWQEGLHRESAPAEPAPPGDPRAHERAILSCAESWKRRREAQEVQWARLRRGIPASALVGLPLVYDAESPLQLVQVLSRALETPGGRSGASPTIEVAGHGSDRIGS
jgi:anion-transporting  ArsA/GET3 family ATPase